MQQANSNLALPSGLHDREHKKSEKLYFINLQSHAKAYWVKKVLQQDKLQKQITKWSSHLLSCMSPFISKNKWNQAVLGC